MKIDLANLNYSNIVDEEEALRIVNLVNESKKKEQEKETTEQDVEDEGVFHQGLGQFLRVESHEVIGPIRPKDL